MESASAMLRTNPERAFTGIDALSECIQACLDCEQACTACADACCSVEGMQELRQCIRMCLDCADLCGCCARIFSRQQSADIDLVRRHVQLLTAVCRACADECARHKEHPFCGICMEACRRCEAACKHILQAIGISTPAPAAGGTDF
jgi:hypothetical protein